MVQSALRTLKYCSKRIKQLVSIKYCPKRIKHAETLLRGPAENAAWMVRVERQRLEGSFGSLGDFIMVTGSKGEFNRRDPSYG